MANTSCKEDEGECQVLTVYHIFNHDIACGFVIWDSNAHVSCLWHWRLLCQWQLWGRVKCLWMWWSGDDLGTCVWMQQSHRYLPQSPCEGIFHVPFDLQIWWQSPVVTFNGNICCIVFLAILFSFPFDGSLPSHVPFFHTSSTLCLAFCQLGCFQCAGPFLDFLWLTMHFQWIWVAISQILVFQAHWIGFVQPYPAWVWLLQVSQIAISCWWATGKILGGIQELQWWTHCLTDLLPFLQAVLAFASTILGTCKHLHYPSISTYTCGGTCQFSLWVV